MYSCEKYSMDLKIAYLLVRKESGHYVDSFIHELTEFGSIIANKNILLTDAM